jgi:hypothetical protein
LAKGGANYNSPEKKKKEEEKKERGDLDYYLSFFKVFLHVSKILI